MSGLPVTFLKAGVVGLGERKKSSSVDESQKKMGATRTVARVRSRTSDSNSSSNSSSSSGSISRADKASVCAEAGAAKFCVFPHFASPNTQSVRLLSMYIYSERCLFSPQNDCPPHVCPGMYSGYARVGLVLTSYYLAETNWKAR